MVSEDELPTETKEQLETEAVSDEELPESSVKENADLPETESVSEDELPVEANKKKRKKVAQTAGMVFSHVSLCTTSVEIRSVIICRAQEQQGIKGQNQVQIFVFRN